MLLVLITITKSKLKKNLSDTQILSLLNWNTKRVTRMVHYSLLADFSDYFTHAMSNGDSRWLRLRRLRRIANGELKKLS